MRIEVATLGGGCFWCLEAVFEQLKGVHKVVSGYAGGPQAVGADGSAGASGAGGFVASPTYEQVCEGVTGHAEVTQVTFDPDILSYHDLLEVFFTIHDPTTKDRQGNDVGSQYRSIVLYHSPHQRETAERVMKEVAPHWGTPLVTEVQPFKEFFPAESYHQGYFRKNPTQGYCRAVVSPKVAKFRAKWASRLRA